MAEQTFLEIDSPKNRQLILDKSVKTIQWRKDSFFSTNSAKKIEHLYAKKKKMFTFDRYLIVINIYSKWITDLNISDKSM